MNRRDPYNAYSYENEDGQWPYGEEQAQEPYVEEYGEEQQGYEPPLYQEEAYEEPYEELLDEPREAPVRPQRPAREPRRPQVISTNATINLTCTICAGSGLFGLFLFFADRRSRAVRRFAVQSAGLFCVMAFLTIGLALFAALFGYIPFIGGVMSGLVWILLAALLGWSLYQRVQLMSHAYRGEAYVVPVIGKHCRSFE